MAGIGSGLLAEITATSPTQSYPVPVTVTFKKNGSNHAVSNFANDFTSSFKVGSTPGTETLVGRLQTVQASFTPLVRSVYGRTKATVGMTQFRKLLPINRLPEVLPPIV